MKTSREQFEMHVRNNENCWRGMMVMRLSAIFVVKKWLLLMCIAAMA